ncbi:MAG TPA: SigE family RNA polymerase sigma factor [Streptosporangiaceae bacterium]|nr:SigE family RNA polymerase sigma factor [Streptosporangiaceae bacterium]
MRLIDMGTNPQPFALSSSGGPGPDPAPPPRPPVFPRHPPVRRRHADGWSAQVRDDTAASTVTALYQASALGLVRLAHVLIGDRGAAEDIVQDAFSGLYWRWEQLRDTGNALPYVRSAVLNSCRSALRRGGPAEVLSADLPDFGLVLASAEAVILSEEQRRAVMTALRSLPSRQREVLVLRFYLDLSETEIAAQMGIGKSSVRSAQHRALAALGRMLKEAS